MNIWHKRLIYIQCAVLALAALAFYLKLPWHNYAVFLFTVLEFAVLETQRTENENAVFYRKSCLFAVIDMASVVYFVTYFIRLAVAYFHPLPEASFYTTIALFAYIIIRKLYIAKNYYYEK